VAVLKVIFLPTTISLTQTAHVLNFDFVSKTV